MGLARIVPHIKSGWGRIDAWLSFKPWVNGVRVGMSWPADGNFWISTDEKRLFVLPFAVNTENLAFRDEGDLLAVYSPDGEFVHGITPTRIFEIGEPIHVRQGAWGHDDLIRWIRAFGNRTRLSKKRNSRDVYWVPHRELEKLPAMLRIAVELDN